MAWVLYSLGLRRLLSYATHAACVELWGKSQLPYAAIVIPKHCSQDLENRHPQEQHTAAAKQPEAWLEAVQVPAMHHVASCSSPGRSSPTRTLHLMESPVRVCGELIARSFS